MAKKVKVILKLNLPAGKANPAPPIGPALGQHGIAIMEFCKQYNEKTKAMQGVIPAVITIFEDRSFTFILKKPPVSEFIKKELKIEHGSKTPAGKPPPRLPRPNWLKSPGKKWKTLTPMTWKRPRKSSPARPGQWELR